MFLATLIQAIITPANYRYKLTFAVLDAVSKLPSVESFSVFKLPFAMWLPKLIKFSNIDVIFPDKLSLEPATIKIASLISIFVSLFLSKSVNSSAIEIPFKSEVVCQIFKIPLYSSVCIMPLENVPSFKDHSSSAIF